MQENMTHARARWWAATVAAVLANSVFALVAFLVGQWVIGGLFLLVALAVGMARENQRQAFRAGWHCAHELPYQRMAPQPWEAGSRWSVVDDGS